MQKIAYYLTDVTLIKVTQTHFFRCLSLTARNLSYRPGRKNIVRVLSSTFGC